MSRHPGWPADLGPLRVAGGLVTVRSVRLRDAAAWSRLRTRDRDHLEPWEPTGESAWDMRHHISVWPGLYRSLRAEARKGLMVPMAIELDGRYCGQITVGNIVRGALRSAWIGYWVEKEVNGLGVATAASRSGSITASAPSVYTVSRRPCVRRTSPAARSCAMSASVRRACCSGTSMCTDGFVIIFSLR